MKPSPCCCTSRAGRIRYIRGAASSGCRPTGKAGRNCFTTPPSSPSRDGPKTCSAPTPPPANATTRPVPTPYRASAPSLSRESKANGRQSWASPYLPWCKGLWLGEVSLLVTVWEQILYRNRGHPHPILSRMQDQSWTYPSPCLRLYFGLGGSVHHSGWHGNCP